MNRLSTSSPSAGVAAEFTRSAPSTALPQTGPGSLTHSLLSTSSPSAVVTELTRGHPSVASPPGAPADLAHDHLPPASPATCISLAHDYLLVMRGAERTFAAIADLYPQAPILTLLYDEQGTNERFAGRSIHTSPLQRLGVGQSRFRRLLPLYPLAVERLKRTGVRCGAQQQQRVRTRPPQAGGRGSHLLLLHALSLCVGRAGLRPRRGLAACCVRCCAGSCAAYADGISPPATGWTPTSRSPSSPASGSSAATAATPPSSIRRWRPTASHRGNQATRCWWYPSWCATSAHTWRWRRPAARASPIRVVGSGPDHAALAKSYPEAEFLGRAGDEELVELYASARAVVVPSVEEFGITAVEAQAAGRPVIAAAAGGALETVLDGETGRLAIPDDVESFTRAIGELDELDFDPARAMLQRRALLGCSLPAAPLRTRDRGGPEQRPVPLPRRHEGTLDLDRSDPGGGSLSRGEGVRSRGRRAPPQPSRGLV